MSLKEVANELTQLSQSTDVNQADWENTKQKYNEALQETNDAQVLRDIIQEDVMMELAIESRIATHERLLSIERLPEDLRDFAYYLQLHGPDWDDKAADLIAEADKLEHNNS